MSDSRSTGNDPSMDEILASIRKIISDDEARARAANRQAGGQPAHPAVAAAEPRPEPTPHDSDDVLLLTNPIEDVKSDTASSPNPQPLVDRPAEGALISASTGGAAASAFARLSQAVQDGVPSQAAHDPGPAIGGKSMEDVVKELLRPMLREWLDRNLPGLVERCVEREIVRLTRR